MAPNMSLHSVVAILILSTDTPPDNSRLFAKYYSAPHTSLTTQTPTQPYKSVKDQKSFEKGLLEKTSKQTSDVILYDNKIIVFKMESDVMLYVVGNVDENEILLYNVVLALRDSLSILLKYAAHSPHQLFLCAPNDPQELNRQTHNHGELRSRNPSHRRDRRRRHRPRDRSSNREHKGV